MLGKDKLLENFRVYKPCLSFFSLVRKPGSHLFLLFGTHTVELADYITDIGSGFFSKVYKRIQDSEGEDRLH
jgi:hypothetical protein